MIPDDDARQPVQVLGPPIIAEPVPRFPHATRARTGERVDRGVQIEKTGPEHGHTRNLRLLQHELGDQDVVRITGGAPGEVPPLGAEPGEEPACEG